MNKKHFKTIGVLASGTIVGQVALVAAFPIITRLYTPESFGLFSVYTIILYLFLSIVCFRYDAAIVLTEDASEVNKLVSLAGAICLIFSSIIGVLGFAYYLSGEKNELQAIGLYLSIGVLLAGFSSIVMHVCLRYAKHKTVALSKTGVAIFSVVIQIILGEMGLGAQGLIFGQIVGIFAGGVILYCGSASFFKIVTSLQILSDAAIKYVRYPRDDSLGAVIVVANNHVMVMVSALMSAAADAGVVAMINRVVNTPLSVLSSSISNTILSYSSEKVNTDKNRSSNTISSSLFFFEMIMMVLGLIAYKNFDVIFGASWIGYSEIIIFFFLAAPVKLFYEVSYAGLISRGGQRLGSIVQLTNISLRVIVLYICLWGLDFKNGIILYMVFSSIIYCVCFYRIKNELDGGSEGVNKGGAKIVDLIVFSGLAEILSGLNGGSNLVLLEVMCVWVFGRLAFEIYTVCRHLYAVRIN